MKLPPVLLNPLLFMGCLLLRLLGRTLRFHIHDTAGFTAKPPVVPSINVLWHNRIVLMPYFSQRFANSVSASVLTSSSRDGDLLSRVVRHFGLGAVRGSSSRRGVAAMRELVDLVRGGETVAVTPDGPRGPVYEFKPGALHLALHTGAPLFLYGVNFSRFIALKSWDGFRIPLPFSRVDVRIKTPDFLGLSEDNLEESLRMLEQEMNTLNRVHEHPVKPRRKK